MHSPFFLVGAELQAGHGALVLAGPWGVTGLLPGGLSLGGRHQGGSGRQGVGVGVWWGRFYPQSHCTKISGHRKNTVFKSVGINPTHEPHQSYFFLVGITNFECALC